MLVLTSGFNQYNGADGKVVAIRFHLERDEALRAAGLPKSAAGERSDPQISR